MGTRSNRIVRLAALFHDVGKPETKAIDRGGVTFHHHEVVGARLTRARLRELRYSKDEIDDVSDLVYLHMRPHTFKMGWTDRAVRRYVRDAGPLLDRLNVLVRCDVTTANASDLTMFEATLDSNIAGTAGVSYRWDFGDGSAYTAAYESNQVSHTYEVCGTYTVRVEATDSWGNKTIGTLQVPVSQCEAHVRYLPVVAKSP